MESGDFYQQFSSIIDWVGTHQTLSGFLIFLVAMTESLVLVGILMPGAILMVGAGILVSLGKLELWPCIAWAAAGAVAGDGFSFWVGHHYKDRLRQIWPFTKTKNLLIKGEDFFKKHGGKSIVLGRFFGPVRAIVPTIAGMLGMSPGRFAVVNILSALAWAPAYLLPGVLVGASLQLASEIAVRLVMIVIVIVIFYIVAHWAIKHIVRYLQRHISSITHALLSWSGRHPFIGRYTNALLTPDTPAYKTLIISGTLFFLASMIFILMLFFGFGEANKTGISYTTYNFLQSLRNPITDQFMVFLTMLADPWVYISTLTITSLWLSYRKLYSAIAHLLFASGLAAILMLVLSAFIHSPASTTTSDNSLVGSYSISHITLSLVIYGFIAILLSRASKRTLRGHAYIAVTTLITLIVFSRLYLGHFWLSDIVASMMLGLILLSLTGISFQTHSEKKFNARQLLLVSSVTLAIAISSHVFLHFEQQQDTYQLKLNVRKIDAQLWWDKYWQKLPTWRNDLRNIKHQPMNIQFAGDIKQLTQHLLKKGWEVPAKFRMTNMVHWLYSNPELSRLPVLPQVHQGRHHELILIYPMLVSFWTAQPEKQWVLRLWKSHYEFSSDSTTIYIGNVSTQTTRRSLGFISYPDTGSDFNSPMIILLRHIKQYNVKLIKRVTRSQNGIQWNGQLLLFRGRIKH